MPSVYLDVYVNYPLKEAYNQTLLSSPVLYWPFTCLRMLQWVYPSFSFLVSPDFLLSADYESADLVL